MNNVTAPLPQLPAAVTVEASMGMFGAPCIRVGVLPLLTTRAELAEHKELIYWLVSTALMREQQKLAEGFQRDHTAYGRSPGGRLMELGISIFSSLVDDFEISVQVDVPGVSTAHLRRSFDRVFGELFDRVDQMREYAKEAGHD